MRMSIDTRLRDPGIKAIDDAFAPATPGDVLEIESRLGGALPADYSHFLLSYGYAMFGDMVCIPLPDGDEAPIAIFFGGGESRASVMKQLLNYGDQLPQGVVPIGRDPFGNLFLLEVASQAPGRVWYATFEQELETVPVANSFEEFLNRLTVEPDDD